MSFKELIGPVILSGLTYATTGSIWKSVAAGSGSYYIYSSLVYYSSLDPNIDLTTPALGLVTFSTDLHFDPLNIYHPQTSQQKPSTGISGDPDSGRYGGGGDTGDN